MPNLIRTYTNDQGQSMYDWQTDDGEVHSTALVPETQGLYSQLQATQAPAPSSFGGPAPEPQETEDFGPAPSSGFAVPVASLSPSLSAPITPEALYQNEPVVGIPESTIGGGLPAPAPTLGTGISPIAAAPDFVEETQTTTTGKVLDKGLEKKLNAAQEAYLAKETAVSDAVVAQARADEEEAIAKAVELKRTTDAELARQADEQDEINKRQASLDAMVQEYDGASIDSGRFWGRMDTGNKILAGIALSLGALGQALTGSKTNYALDQIDKSIDRDIDEQKHNLEKQGRQVAQARGLYADFRQKVGDDRTARSMAREAAWKAIQSDFDVKAKTAKTAEVRAAAEQGAAASQMKVDQERLDRTAQTQTTVKSRKAVTPKDPKTIFDKLPEGPRKELDADYRVYEGSRRLEKLVASPAFQNNAGIVAGNWAKWKDSIGLPVDENLKNSANEIDRIKYDVLKAMSGSGVTSNEMARYDPLFADIAKDPKTALNSARAYRAGMEEKYANTWERTAAGAHLTADPQFNTMYPRVRVQNSKEKVGFTK